jgi:hypothetical protein
MPYPTTVHLNPSLQFEDPLPSVQAAAAISVPESSLSVTTALALSEVAVGSEAAISGLITLKAPVVQKPDLPASERNGVDIIAVVDRSGSMQGEKINLLQSTLRYLLTQLTAKDRLSIIPFNTYSSVLCHLRRVTDEAKPDLEMVIRSIDATGGTSIWAGLANAINVAKNRTTKNPVCSLLLLTDGQDDRAFVDVKAQLQSSLPEGCTVDTFGYGIDHDALLCSEIAKLGNGRFSFVQNNAGVGPAFASVLGGLLSVYAQPITIRVLPRPGVIIEAVRTCYTSSIAPNGIANIAIPNIFEDERRDIVLLLHLSPVNAAVVAGIERLQQEVALVETSYTITATAESKTCFTKMIIMRPEMVGFQELNIEVETQVLRCDVADAMDKANKLALANKFDEAQQAFQAQIERLHRLPSSPLIASLLADLEECLKRVNSSQWAVGGQAYLLSAGQQQSRQRNTNTGTYSSQVYTTHSMQSQCNTYDAYAKH